MILCVGELTRVQVNELTRALGCVLISWEVDELTSKQERVSSCRLIFGKIHYPFTPSLFYSFTPPLPDSLLLYSLPPYYLLLTTLLLTTLLLTTLLLTTLLLTTYYLLLPPLLLIPFSRHNNVLLQTNGVEFQIISYLCPVLRT